jgi:hypothetical protein
MRSTIIARDEESLRNGSFVHVTKYKRNTTNALYINGDFMGYVAQLPADLQSAHKQWTLKDARKLMPKI